MIYHRRPALGMDDVHHLLGVTLRDARQGRQGRIVGLDYSHEQPLVDILWEGQKKIERVEVSLETLAGLMNALADARRASSLRAVDSKPAGAPPHSEAAVTSTEMIDEAEMIDEVAERRRA